MMRSLSFSHRMLLVILVSLFSVGIWCTPLYGISKKVQTEIDVAYQAYLDGLYDVAESILKEKITDPKFSCKARLILGKVYIAKGDNKLGIQYLTELSHSSDCQKDLRMDAYMFLFDTYKKMHLWDMAQDLIEELRKIAWITEAEAIRFKSQILLKAGKYDELQKFLRMYENAKDKSVLEVVDYDMAELLFHMGRWQEARRLFTEFIEKYPLSEFLSGATFYLGKIHYFLGDYKKAIEFFDDVCKIYKDKEPCAYALQGKVWCLIRMKEYGQAQLVLEKVKKILKSESDAVEFAEGYLYIKQGRLNLALDKLKGLLSRYPQTKWKRDVFFWLGEVLYNLGKYDEAMKYYSQVIAISSDLSQLDIDNVLVNSYNGLGWCSLKKQNFDAAIEYFSLAASSTDDPFLKQSARIKVADVYFAKGDYAAAIKSYSDFLNDYPESVYQDYAIMQIGICYMKLDKYDQAVLSFQEFLEKFPNSNYLWDVKYNLALSLFNIGEFNRVVEILSEIKEKGKASSYQPHLDYIMATAQFNLSNYKKALHLFNSILKNLEEKDDLRPELEYELAWCYYRLGRKLEAMNRFRKIVDKYPNELLAREVLLWLAEEAISTKKYTQAKDYLEEFIKRYAGTSSIYKAYYDLAWLYAMDGKVDMAIDILSQKINENANPMKGEYRMARAFMYRGKKDFENAVEDLKWIIENAPSLLSKAYEELGKTYRLMDRLADAAYSYEKVLELKERPEDKAQIHYKIGCIWEEAGEWEKAVENFLRCAYLIGEGKLYVSSMLKAAKIYQRKGKIGEAMKIYDKISHLDVPEAKFAKEKLDSFAKE